MVSNINFIGDVVIEKKVVLLNTLRKKIKERKSSTGSWLQLADASAAEIMANSGYDWLAIDLEHGIINAESLVNLCRAIELHGTLPFVISHFIFFRSSSIDLNFSSSLSPDSRVSIR